MDFDKDKVDDMTLALLYLVICERVKGFGGKTVAQPGHEQTDV